MCGRSPSRIDPDELRKLITDNESEVLALLYVLNCERWAEAHKQVALKDGEIKVLEARKHWLEVVIRTRQMDMKLRGERPEPPSDVSPKEETNG